MKPVLKSLAAAAVFCFSAAASAVSVAPNGVLTDLGLFAAGSYQLTGSGVVDLAGAGNFQMNPDGTPFSTVTFPGYAYFNPSGSTIADGNHGPAGNSVKFGSLIGSLNASAFTGSNPTGPQAADWFLIGYSTVVVLAAPGHIYASVNDTFYGNNTGTFDATVSAVPEPGSVVLLLAGVGAVGFMAKRRSA